MAAKKKSSAKRGATTDGDAGLLARVLAARDDDDAVTVYADHLIELGDPRGRFIAEQHALASCEPTDARYPKLLASTRRLEATHGLRWLGSEHLQNPVFERGFLRRVGLDPEHLASEWARLRTHEPIVGVELLVGEGIAPKHRDFKAPLELTELKITPDAWFTSHSVAQVFAWGVPNLRHLDLSGCDLGPDGAKMVVDGFPDGQLRRLVLRASQLHDAGARLLLTARNLAALEELDISQCRIDEPATLSELKKFDGIRRLALAGNQGLGPRLGVLADWAPLRALTSLTLPQTTTVEALRALFPKPSASLHTLDVASAKELGADPDSIIQLSERLCFLDIGTTRIGDDGFRALLGSPSLRHLVQLAANGCSLSDDAVLELTNSRLDRFVSLDLSSNKLTDRALALLATWPGLEQIADLRIGNNRKFTSAGYAALIDAPNFHPAALDLGKLDEKLRAPLEERFGSALLARD
jgi:uncharacterized protein (TIGR02996 family)